VLLLHCAYVLLLLEHVQCAGGGGNHGGTLDRGGLEGLYVLVAVSCENSSNTAYKMQIVCVQRCMVSKSIMIGVNIYVCIDTTTLHCATLHNSQAHGKT
jgi:hypothetical protein